MSISAPSCFLSSTLLIASKPTFAGTMSERSTRPTVVSLRTPSMRQTIFAWRSTSPWSYAARTSVRRGEDAALALRELARAGHVVDAEHHVLRRHDDRLAVRRAEDVVGAHHQHPRLHLSLDGERHVDRHLVAVEVGVERGAHQRVQLDRLALDQHRLEGLDAEAVQGRRAVQQHRVLADDLLEDVPDLGALLLHHLLRALDGGDVALLLELVVDERLEQLEGHDLRQAALVQLQLRARRR